MVNSKESIKISGGEERFLSTPIHWKMNYTCSSFIKIQQVNHSIVTTKLENKENFPKAYGKCKIICRRSKLQHLNSSCLSKFPFSRRKWRTTARLILHFTIGLNSHSIKSNFELNYLCNSCNFHLISFISISLNNCTGTVCTSAVYILRLTATIPLITLAVSTVYSSTSSAR